MILRILISGFLFIALLAQSHLAIASPLPKSTCVSLLEDFTDRGYTQIQIKSESFNEEQKNRLLQNFSGRENPRILRESFIADPLDTIGSTVISGDIIEYLSADEDLKIFVPIAIEIAENASSLAPLGYKAIPSGVVIFINGIGKRGDATGEFHQDGAGLIGFATMAAETDELTTRYVDRADIIPYSKLPKDLGSYIPVGGDGRNWTKREKIKFAQRDKIFYFYGIQGKVAYGSKSADPLWHAGPIPMFVEHPKARIAIGMSFVFLKNDDSYQ